MCYCYLKYYIELSDNKKQKTSWALMAPSYSGGRDQEDRGSKAALANSSRNPILKNSSQKRAGNKNSMVLAQKQT
jgi:hypothetical protein